MNRNISLIKAPSILGLRPTGVERMPDTLEPLLGKRINFVGRDIISPLEYCEERDKDTGIKNTSKIRQYSSKLSYRIQQEMIKGNFPLVLGGDCSITLGIALGLKKFGRYGFISLDGHADFYRPLESPTGECADIVFGLITGSGPKVLTDIDGKCPYIREEDAVLFGYRDIKETIKNRSRDVRDSRINCFSFSIMKTSSELERMTDSAIEYLTARKDENQLNGFWLHLDADVLRSEDMPAVDYKVKGGLDYVGLEYILSRLLKRKECVGMDVTIFNPNKDKDGKIAKKFSEVICDGLVGKV